MILGTTRKWFPCALVLLGACVLTYPWAIWGLQPGHDSGTHLLYFHSFGQQFRAGDLYPRWLPDVNDGIGSPIFFMQYPLPYYAGLAVQAVMQFPHTTAGEVRSLGLVFFLGAVFLAFALYSWCRRFSDGYPAAMAGLAGLALPYVLCIDFYTRAAIGECIALGFAAVALGAAHDLDRKRLRAICTMGIAVALLILSHIFSAVLFLPFIVCYAVAINRRDRFWRTVSDVFWAGMLGVGVAGVYVLPMLSHRQYFDLTPLATRAHSNYNFENHLFPINSSVVGAYPTGWWLLNVLLLSGAVFSLLLWWHGRKERQGSTWTENLVAGFGLLLMLMTAMAPRFGTHFPWQHTESALVAGVILRSQIFGFVFLTLELAAIAFLSLRGQRSRQLRVFLFAGVCACFVLMTRWSALLWDHIHILWNIQFTWRFAGPMSILTTGLLALWYNETLTRHRRRCLNLFITVSLCVGVTALAVFAWSVQRNFLGRMSKPVVASRDVALPTYAHFEKVYESDVAWMGHPGSAHTGIGNGKGNAQLTFISPRHYLFNADCVGTCTAELHLLDFPGWQAREKSGIAVRIHSSAQTGLMQMDLPPGHHEIELAFPRDTSETAGAFLTIFSLGVAVCLLFASSSLFTTVRKDQIGFLKGCVQIRRQTAMVSTWYEPPPLKPDPKDM